MPRAPARGDPTFRIESSGPTGGPIFISPDVATCDECLRELFDPADRRYRYPFLNCTNCGPRLTITTAVPVRPRADDHGPRSPCAARAGRSTRTRATAGSTPSRPPARRAGRGCGCSTAGAGRSRPTIRWLEAAAALRSGRIVALKGLGGYHLACDARDGRAVAELRRRKHRDEKPFAVMVAGPRGCRRARARSPTPSGELPAPRRDGRSSCCAGGPARRWRPRSRRTRILGVMLPYTPLASPALAPRWAACRW